MPFSFAPMFLLQMHITRSSQRAVEQRRQAAEAKPKVVIPEPVDRLGRPSRPDWLREGEIAHFPTK